MNSNFLLKNARIYTPSGPLERGSVLVQKGRIASIDPMIEGRHWAQDYKGVDEIIDVKGMNLIPGFIDVHVHGGGGYDVMRGHVQNIDGMSLFHAKRGTTAFLPTTLTADLASTEQAIMSVVEAMEKGTQGAEAVGIHLEGPFLNPKRCGAQNPTFIRNGTLEELERFLSLSKGNVRLMTIAPEQVGALGLIQHAIEKGITISIGHSDATYDIVKRSVELGVSHITHLFNGMSPLHHREPGVAGSAMMLDELAVELICDGHHVHQQVIEFVFRTKPIEKIVLITDSMSAAGLPDGKDYNLGGLSCYMKDGQVRLKDTNDLAGSCLTMDQALRNALHFTNRPLQDILPALTSNPARQIGIAGQKGSIEVGKDADLVILDESYQVVSTFVKGRNVFNQ